MLYFIVSRDDICQAEEISDSLGISNEAVARLHADGGIGVLQLRRGAVDYTRPVGGKGRGESARLLRERSG